ncbi:ankyrin repeat-containing domain protein [Tricladium varicosporioides]|nr:ankyrin repeat-containing domain protein [Hymenoscyphus varicosporioides]
MNLMCLPDPLMSDIIAFVVSDGEINELLALRRVNRLFDTEVMLQLSRKRLSSLCRYHEFGGKTIQLSSGMKLKLVMYNVGTFPGTSNYTRRLIHAVTDRLLQDYAINISSLERPKLLEAVCRAALGIINEKVVFKGLSEYNTTMTNILKWEEVVTRGVFVVAIAILKNHIWLKLLDEGINPNFVEPVFGSPLAAAARVGNLQAVELLLSYPISDPESADIYQSSLAEAARCGLQEVFMNLFNSRDNFRVMTRRYGEIARTAVRYGNPKIASIILNSTIVLDNRVKRGILRQAAKQGHNDLITEMLDSGTTPNVFGLRVASPIAEAARQGHPSTVKLLLSRGALSRHRRSDAFQVAVSAGHLEITELLYPPLVALDSERRICRGFVAAVKAGQRLVAQYLLDRGCSLQRGGDEFRKRSLWGAIIDNQAEMVRWLIADHGLSPDCFGKLKGHEPSQQEEGLQSPLLLASQTGHHEIKALLIELGAGKAS